MDYLFSKDQDNKELLDLFMTDDDILDEFFIIEKQNEEPPTIEKLFKSFEEEAEISEHVKVKILKLIEINKLADNIFDYFNLSQSYFCKYFYNIVLEEEMEEKISELNKILKRKN